eukprot:7940293-Alexandrium_andersonii.AAC.1
MGQSISRRKHSIFRLPEIASLPLAGCGKGLSGSQQSLIEWSAVGNPLEVGSGPHLQLQLQLQ